jgi:hypothetical protein
MKIYIVTSGSYSDYHIDAVFTDEEQAKLYCAVHDNDYDTPGIEEWEADEVKLETSLEVADKWVAKFDFEGHLECLNYLCLSLKKPNSVYRSTWRRVEDYVSVYVPQGTDEEKVRKICCDFFAQWKCEQQEVK